MFKWPLQPTANKTKNQKKIELKWDHKLWAAFVISFRIRNVQQMRTFHSFDHFYFENCPTNGQPLEFIR